MGTRADFYVGRGTHAEWLGSVGYDGYPDGWPGDPKYGPIVAVRTDATFREMVQLMLADCDSATVPAQGWPWPWLNSRLTDFAYAFDEGRVWVTTFGHGWRLADENPTWDDDDLLGPKVPFPNMKDKQRVTMGKRSGILVIGPSGPIDGDADE
jgi:hypothetical protein